MDTRWGSNASGDAAGLTNSTRDTLLMKCKKAIEALSDDLDQERKTRVAAERKIVALRRDLSTLEEELNILRKRDETFAVEVETDTKEKSALKKRVAVLEEQLSHLSQENSELVLKSRAVVEELESAHVLLDSARRELSEKQASIDDWADTVAAVESRLRVLSEENEMLKKERNKYLANCEKLLGSSEQMEEMWKTAKSEAQETAEKLEKLREIHMEKVAEKERERALQHQTLTETFSQRMMQLQEEMQKTVRELKTEKEVLSKEHAKVTEENGKLTQQLLAVNSQLAVVKSELERCEKEKKGFEGQIKALKTEFESTCNEYHREAEMKEKLYIGAASRMEEEIRAHDQTRRRVEDLAAKLNQSDSLLSSKSSDFERRLDDALSDLRRKTSENDDLRKTLAALQKDTAESIARLKKEHMDVVTRLQTDADRSHAEAVRSLEDHIRRIEAERIAEHEQHQIELLRLKDEYTQVLITSSEEVKDLRKDRNRSRSTIAELERRISSLASKVQGRAGKRSLQLVDTGTEDREGAKDGEGARVLGQLRDLTAKLERSTLGNRY